MLDLLCKSGLTVLSWIIVFMPFILLTAITLLLLFSLGLSPDQGFLKYEVKNDNDVNPLGDDVNPLGDDVNPLDDEIELTTNVKIENMFNM
tara:strand:+ start:200 stop:472 length:273 start_codon:yes stop_codon:yes gene_type:complete